MAIQVKISQAIAIITTAIKAKLVPMMAGSPGCGKSQVYLQIADEYGLKVIDLRLSQCDPTDLLGFPCVTGKRAGYMPMETFPIQGDPVPEGFNGWMLFLDEFTSASPAVQAAAYKLVLDRMVGLHHLHEKVIIVCAGNLETDNAIVQPMSTALQSRLVHLELMVDSEEWINWAVNHKINHKITDYIKFKPGNLFNFSPDHTDKTFACPRTWEFLNRVIGVLPAGSEEEMALYAGTISEGVTREFVSFCKIYDDLPKMDEIIAKPDSVKMPDEPSILYALSGSLAHNSKAITFDKIVTFIKRMPVEFQVVTMRETVRRNPAIKSHEGFRNWVTQSAVNMF